MQLHGTVQTNLEAAVRSARRLRGHPVHGDTLAYWTDLLHQARRKLISASPNETSLSSSSSSSSMTSWRSAQADLLPP
jgi:riboflavin synthase alpha subunit